MDDEIEARRLVGQGFRAGGVSFGIVWVPESFGALDGLILRLEYRVGSLALSSFGERPKVDQQVRN